MLISACSNPPDSAQNSEPGSFLPAAKPIAEGCGDDGRLSASLFGALQGELAWTSNTMHCEGMPRPNNRGARLRFSGIAGSDKLTLAIIIAVPDLEPSKSAAELPSNVTVIEEGNGRFFSTVDLDNCWTDIDDQRALDTDTARFAISGTLYCISPLAEVNGSASISIPELEFSGLIDWGDG